jgi:NAD-dependent deacetylase
VTETLPPALRARLAEVRSVAVVTGAGVSQESGIPTYRGVGGIYDDPTEGDRTVEALSAPTLAADPDRTWRVVAELAQRSLAARPGAAHAAIVRIERTVERFVLLTQNVDGLHRAAGSRNLIEIHGDVLDTRCLVCGARGRLDPSTLAALCTTPRCAGCGGRLRPDAVLFGEMLPEDKLLRIQRELVEEAPDLVLVAGTSALFPYVQWPAVAAARAGRLVVEVNPEPTVLSDLATFVLRGRAGAWLPVLAGALVAAERA